MSCSTRFLALILLPVLASACDKEAKAPQNPQAGPPVAAPVMPAASTKLVVGALLPLTGPAAEAASFIRRGMELAESEIEAKDPEAFDLIFSDSKNNPATGVSAFQQLVATTKPPIVISALSSVTKAVAPLAKSSDTIVIATAVAIPGITDISDYVYRVSPDAKGVAGVMAKYAAKECKSMGIAYINDDFGLTCVKEFEHDYVADGRLVTIKEPFAPVEKDFRPQWDKFKTANPECVWIAGYGPAYATLIRQMREAQVPGKLVADMTLGMPSTRKAVGDAAEGVVYVDGPMDPGFVERFQAKFHEAPASYAGYGYDIVRILDQVRRGGGTTVAGLKAGLGAVKDFPGAMGPITIGANRDGALSYVLMRVTGGVAVKVGM